MLTFSNAFAVRLTAAADRPFATSLDLALPPIGPMSVPTRSTRQVLKQVSTDEFSSFARMPKARSARDDITDCVRQAIFLMRVGRADIAFEEQLPEEPIFADFDRRLVSQALTNVLKNATEGIDALNGEHGKGVVTTTVSVDDAGFAEIAVSDNGKGFPSEDRHRLIEPYVT